MTFPSHWRIERLGDIADTALGKMLDRGKFRGYPQVPYLRNVNVQWGRIDTDDLLTMELPDHERDRFGVQPGDLLVCEGGEVGRAAIWRGRAEYLAYQKALHRIRSRGEVEPAYLRYLLEHYSRVGRLGKHATGSTILHLPQQNLRQLPVPLPSLGEQRRIVAILEDHLSRLDAAEAQLEQGQMRATAYFAAVADATIFKPGWPTLPVRNLLREGLRNGHSAPATSGPGAVRTLTLTAVTKDDFSDRYTKLTKADRAKVRGLWLEPGDILVQRSNTPELVGSAAMYRGPRDWVIFPDLLIRIRPDEDRVMAEYLVRALQTERIHMLLRSRAKGLAGSMPKIDQGAIADLQVPVPPEIEIQAAVAARMCDAAGERDRLVAACTQARRRSANLRRAVLAAAFSGKLTSARDVTDMVEEMANV